MSERETMIMAIESIKRTEYTQNDEVVPYILLKGRDINGKKVSANIRYERAASLGRVLDDFIIDVPLEDQFPIISLEGYLKEHSFEKNGRTIKYNRLETSSFRLETGLNLEFLRQEFNVCQTAREDRAIYDKVSLLRQSGDDIRACDTIMKYMEEKLKKMNSSEHSIVKMPEIDKSGWTSVIKDEDQSHGPHM